MTLIEPSSEALLHIKLSAISKLIRDNRITFDEVERLSSQHVDDVLDVVFKFARRIKVKMPSGESVVILPNRERIRH